MPTPRQLYVVRHGVAEDEHPDHPDSDHHRRLTQVGRERARNAALGARRLGLVPDVIWSSPHTRAQETAEIFAEVLCPPRGVQEETSLALGVPPFRVIDRIAAGAVETLMIVGHNPQLSELVSDLVAAGRLRLGMKKAALAHVQLASLSRGLVGELCGYYPARVLQATAVHD